MERVLALMQLENDEAQQLDVRGVNAPTIIEFFDAYTPLMVNSSNYILDIARFQTELVIHPSFVKNVRMEYYNSSIIAFAAMMRADDAVRALIPYDDDDDDYYYDDDEDDKNWVSRGDHDGLINDLMSWD